MKEFKLEGIVMLIFSMEDYIEKIYFFIEMKGYVRVLDIVDELFVYFFFVIKMV